MKIKMHTLAASLAAIVCLLPHTDSYSQSLPSQSYGTLEKGGLLSHSAPEMGRLTIIEILGDYVITIPEKPSSPPNSDFIVRAWDMSDPTNPVEVATFGETTHPFQAHGVIKRLNEIFIGGDTSFDAIRLQADGSLVRADWSGPEGDYYRSGLSRPWGARTFWSYDDISGDSWLSLDGQVTARWDHVGQTGVIGFPHFMGNLLIYASDQSFSGVASYDVSDPANPLLLDVFNLPAQHPTVKDWEGNPVNYGIGGYWSEIGSHYVVFARRDSAVNKLAGIQVVDFSDPRNLRLQCEFLTKAPPPGTPEFDNEALEADPMYVNFQDGWIFAGEFKIDIETCEMDLMLDERGDRDGGEPHWVDTSQYSRPIGNLWLTGGQLSNWRWPSDSNGAGLGVWVHQENVDTAPPYVSYHIPEVGQTNYPIMAPLSFMIPETLRSETIRMGETVTVAEVGGSQIALDYVLSHAGMLTVDPDSYLKPDTTYEVRLAGIEDAMHNAMAEYVFRFSTGDAVLGDDDTPPPVNNAPTIADVSRSPQGQVLVGEVMNVTVTANDVDGDALEYRYRIDGDTYSPWSSSNVFLLNFDAAGQYAVTLQVQDSQQASAAQQFTVTAVVDTPPLARPAVSSSQVTHESGSDAIWVVNPDNDTVSRVSRSNRSLIAEYPVGDDPRSVAMASDGTVWVTSFGNDRIQVLDPVNGSVIADIGTGYGSAPFAIAMNPAKAEAYVSLYGAGAVVRLSTETRSETGRLSLGNTARALALRADGGELLITRLISSAGRGEVWQVDTNSWQVTNTFQLHKHLENDSLENGRGIPNYITSVVINNSGTRAYVAGTKVNVDRGLINGGTDLDDDNTVRTFAAVLNLETGQELRDQRIDFDNADSPAALTLTPNGSHLLVAMQGRNQIFAVNVDGSTGGITTIAAQFASGHAPQALHMDAETSELFVKNFTDRSLDIFVLGEFLNSGSKNPGKTTVVTVLNEALAPEVLAGKRTFYDASAGVQEDGNFIGKMSAEGYLSCATCHLDGGQDGQTYDFSGRGEGLRNNISLKGRGGVRFGPVHWSGNFDEIQDFENDIRSAFLGRGFMSDQDFSIAEDPLGIPKAGASVELDELAAYLASLGQQSLPRSPARNSNDGALTASGVRGKAVFDLMACGNCHRGNAFTDGDMHNVGTLRTYSGDRSGDALTGIKTPSLLALFDTAPYLHDGSARELDDVFRSAGGSVLQAESMSTDGHLVQQSGYSYLRGGAAVELPASRAVSFTHSVASSGTGSIAVRYGSSSGSSVLRVSYNGASYDIALSDLPQVEGQDVNFAEARTLLNMSAGDNAVSITHISSNGSARLLLDDVTVASPSDFTKADAHTRVTELSETDRVDLVAYLLQLDQSNAPRDDETIVLGPIDDPSDDGSEDGSGGESGEGEDDGQGGGEDDGESGGGDDGGSGGGTSDPLALWLLFLAWLRSLSS